MEKLQMKLCKSVGYRYVLWLRCNCHLKPTKTTKNYVFDGPYIRVAQLDNTLLYEVDFCNGSLRTFIPEIKLRLLQYP